MAKRLDATHHDWLALFATAAGAVAAWGEVDSDAVSSNAYGLTEIERRRRETAAATEE